MNASNSAVQYVGALDGCALFMFSGQGTIIELSTGAALQTGPLDELLNGYHWQPVSSYDIPREAFESAKTAFALNMPSDVQEFAFGGQPAADAEVVRTDNQSTATQARNKTFNVPQQVQAVAQRALNGYRLAQTRGQETVEIGVPALATARLLTSGGQVTLAKIRQIAHALNTRHALTAGAHAGEDITQIAHQFWGGPAARRWAQGVINKEDARALAAAAKPAEPAKPAADAKAPEPDTTGAPDDTDEPDPEMDDDALQALIDAGEEVPADEVRDIFTKIGEDTHAFVPAAGNPNLCAYCADGPYALLHGAGREMPYSTAPHMYSEQLGDASDICAICDKPINDPLHATDLLGALRKFKSPLGTVFDEDEAAETGSGSTEGDAPDPVTASGMLAAATTTLRGVDAGTSATELAAMLLELSATERRISYFAGMAPGEADDRVVAVYRRDGDQWQHWSTDTDAWADSEHPTQPLQLLDDDTANRVFSDINQLPLPAVPPLRAYNPEEQAIADAALPEMQAQPVTIITPPDTEQVEFAGVVASEDEDPDLASIAAVVVHSHGGTFLWDPLERVWELADRAALYATESVIELDFHMAAIIADRLSTEGIVRMPLNIDGLGDAVRALQETGFFTIVDGLMVDVGMPDLDMPVDEDELPELDDDDDWDLWDDGHPVYSVENDLDDGEAKRLYAQLADEEWLTWNADETRWQDSDPEVEPHDLVRVSPKQALRFAVWGMPESTLTAAGEHAEAIKQAIQNDKLARSFAVAYQLNMQVTPPRITHRDVFATPGAAPAPAGPDPDYTPQERAKNASKQVRDKYGRFAREKARVMLKDGTTGTISKIDRLRQTVEVRDDSGNLYDVPAKTITVVDADPGQPSDQRPNQTPTSAYGFDGIAAQPRAVARSPKGILPYTLQPMGAAQIRQVVSDYRAFIRSERARATRVSRARQKMESGK